MLKELTSAFRPALVLLAGFVVLTGLAYPFAVTGIGQILFPDQANGSLVQDDGKVVGSSLIGQNFTSARYFHGRPSASGAGYDASTSSGSNLGPASKKLNDRVKAEVAALRAEGVKGDIPADMVTASASGLDPHLSPEATYLQVPRVAKARGLSEVIVRRAVGEVVEHPLLGEPQVNVLMLNRHLDRISANQAS